jgi:hypothetical protein
MTGSNIDVSDKEGADREELAQEVALHAAHLIASRDMSRHDAIEAVAQHLIHLREADNDITRTAETLSEAQDPQPEHEKSAEQIEAIRRELLVEARDAIDRIL